MKHNQSSVTPDLTHCVILLCSGRLMVPVSTKGASTWLSAQQSASPLVWRWA